MTIVLTHFFPFYSNCRNTRYLFKYARRHDWFFSSIAAGSKRWQYSTTSVIRKPNFFRLHLDAAIHPKSCVHFPSIFARTDLYHLVFSAVISRLFSLLFFHKAASPLSLSCSCWSSIKFK